MSKGISGIPKSPVIVTSSPPEVGPMFEVIDVIDKAVAVSEEVIILVMIVWTEKIPITAVATKRGNLSKSLLVFRIRKSFSRSVENDFALYYAKH